MSTERERYEATLKAVEAAAQHVDACGKAYYRAQDALAEARRTHDLATIQYADFVGLSRHELRLDLAMTTEVSITKENYDHGSIR